jgi:hypothetical protein
LVPLDGGSVILLHEQLRQHLVVAVHRGNPPNTLRAGRIDDRGDNLLMPVRRLDAKITCWRFRWPVVSGQAGWKATTGEATTTVTQKGRRRTGRGRRWGKHTCLARRRAPWAWTRVLALPICTPHEGADIGLPAILLGSNDYFTDDATHTLKDFRRQFWMNNNLFMKIASTSGSATTTSCASKIAPVCGASPQSRGALLHCVVLHMELPHMQPMTTCAWRSRHAARSSIGFVEPS